MSDFEIKNTEECLRLILQFVVYGWRRMSVSFGWPCSSSRSKLHTSESHQNRKSTHKFSRLQQKWIWDWAKTGRDKRLVCLLGCADGDFCVEECDHSNSWYDKGQVKCPRQPWQWQWVGTHNTRILTQKKGLLFQLWAYMLHITYRICIKSNYSTQTGTK